MAGRPDLIDTTQLIDRLGLSESELRSLQVRGTFPPPELHFRSRPIWWWDRIEHWSRQRRRTRRKPFQKNLPQLDLVDAATAATRLGLRPRAIEGRLADGHMIEPDYRWSHTIAWQWETIERWIEEGRASDLAPRRAATPVTPVDLPPEEPARELDPFEAALAELKALEDGLGHSEDAAPQLTEARNGIGEQLRAVEQFIERVDGSGS